MNLHSRTTAENCCKHKLIMTMRFAFTKQDSFKLNKAQAGSLQAHVPKFRRDLTWALTGKSTNAIAYRLQVQEGICPSISKSLTLSSSHLTLSLSNALKLTSDTIPLKCYQDLSLATDPARFFLIAHEMEYGKAFLVSLPPQYYAACRHSLSQLNFRFYDI